MMNQTAQKLGMTQTSYVNPNGLPADGQITSARDLAILARAVIRDLPEYEYFMHIPSIRYGRRVTQNFNKLIGRYPGADGFKTGFICASGYNLVASATRNGKRLIAVVLGASSGQARAVRAAQLLERGFGGNGLGWLKPALGTVDNLVPIDATPPNLREEMCNGKRKRPATDEDADIVAANGSASTGESRGDVLHRRAAAADGQALGIDRRRGRAPSEPVPVYTGPTKTGPALIAAVAADAEKQTPAKRGKKSKIAAKKPDAAAPKAEASREAGGQACGAGMRAPNRTLPPSRPLGRKEAGRCGRQKARRQARRRRRQAGARSRPSRRPPLNPRAKTSRLVNGPRSHVIRQFSCRSAELFQIAAMRR